MTPWFNVYRTFAILLRDFYLLHKEKSGEKFYELCIENLLFPLSNNWIRRFSGDPNTRSFDPIHIFTSFNDSKLGYKTRYQRLELLFEILGSRIPAFDLDFDGCPTPFTIKIMSTRPKAVQQNIWKFFECILNNSDNADLDKFPDYDKWYGINLSSLTIFLFWIDHEHFLPLDVNTQNFLKSNQIVAKLPKNFSQYLEFLSQADIPSYLAVSVEAQAMRLIRPVANRSRRIIERKNAPDIQSEKHEADQIDKLASVAFLSGCRMIGLRVYHPTPDKWVKVLKPGKMYRFYRAFTFDDRELKFHEHNDSLIHYDSFRDAQLFNLDSKSVNISAIAGENGSGKSSLIDLVFLAINNVTAMDKRLGIDLKYVDGICLDFYFITDALYKLTINLDVVSVCRYRQNGETFSDPSPVSILAFNLEQLFYTISVNYSLYAMNSDQMGDWIIPLLKKNDQYQVPLVINPYRDQGNININKENTLLRSRLMATLLQPIEEFKVDEKRGNLRKLTSERYAKTLTIKLYDEKFKVFRHKKSELDFTWASTEPFWERLLKEICRVFDIKMKCPLWPPASPKDFKEAAFMYMVQKVVTICLNYQDYEDFIDARSYLIYSEDIPDLVEALKRDTTHVTHKFYQTVNFLKYSHLESVLNAKSIDSSFEFDISELAFKIDTLRGNIADRRLKVTHFIPPPFLETEIVLTGGVKLMDLSSGEKQRIFSVSSLGYHLINLDSNTDTNSLNHYPHVNVLFDEIELYFHPEMQRSFVKYLLDYLEVLEVETRFDLNILFVTHSPFILSDIPSDNILFLGNRVPPGIKTFGSNIHTLLAESFFLEDSFMGDFARSKINDLINFLLDEGEFGEWDENSAAQVISLIGEPLIRERLTEIYRAKYQNYTSREVKISALENELMILRNETNQE